MRFLIVGFGSIGRRHFRNLISLGEKDIFLLRSNKSTLDTQETEGFLVETDLQQALAQKPDVVMLTNPTSLHMKIAIPAAKQGCHLFFEKPVAESMERIPELLTAIEEGGGKAFTGFQFRFHPGLQRIKTLLDSGTIGKVVSARAHWGEYLPGWHPWEDYKNSYCALPELGGGVIRTLCHPLDYLRWFFGDVKAVSSFYAPVVGLDIPSEGVAEIGLQFVNQIIASVHVNYIERPARHTIDIVGEKGTIRWNNADGAVELYSVEKGTWQRFDLPLGFDRNDLFMEELKNFLAYIQKGKPPKCSLEDGIEAQRLIQAVLYSGTEQKVIELI